MAPGAERGRASLWMYLIGIEATEALQRGELDNAEAAYKQTLGYLVSLNQPDVEENISIAYHQIGIIAQERRQFAIAEQWYKKALEISERLSLDADAAGEYHQLGRNTHAGSRILSLQLSSRLYHPAKDQ